MSVDRGEKTFGSKVESEGAVATVDGVKMSFIDSEMSLDVNVGGLEAKSEMNLAKKS